MRKVRSVNYSQATDKQLFHTGIVPPHHIPTNHTTRGTLVHMATPEGERERREWVCTSLLIRTRVEVNLSCFAISEKMKNVQKAS